MASFFYKCKFEDRIIEGYINAKDVADASKKLVNKKYVVLEIKQIADLKESPVLKYNIKPLTLSEKKDFYSAFQRQYRAGVPFLEIFNNLFATASSFNIKSLAFRISKKIQNGDTISDIFSYFSPYIGKTEAALVIAGDKSGTLVNILEKISKQIQEDVKNLAEFKSKLTYPLVLLTILFFAVMIFIFFVFPIFDMISNNTPFCIKNIAFAAIFKILLRTFLFAIVVNVIFMNKVFKKCVISFFLKFNFVKNILNSYRFSNFFSTLALAHEAGLTFGESIELSKDLICEEEQLNKIETMHKMVQEGCKIGTAFNIAAIFSDYAVSQITSGEESGELSNFYNDISQDYKMTYKTKIDTFLKAFEPLLLVVVGVFVAIICVNMMMKYYNTLFSIL